jgi:hypothetical protein
MTTLHFCRATATTMILLVQPITTTVSAWTVPRSSVQPRPMVRSGRDNNIIGDVSGKITSTSHSSRTRPTMLAFDPSDVVAAASSSSSSHHDHVSSALDALSSITLAKATAAAMHLPPNQSVAPLSETIRSFIEGDGGGGGGGNTIEVIPDMPAMPGGTPRSGNPFLAGTFREIYDSAIQPTNARMIEYNNVRNADGTVTIPSRELDVVARYSDLLSRIPLAAAVYAIFDFFIINAEEDVAIYELLSYDGDDGDEYYDDDDDDGEYGNRNNIEAIMDVENRVLTQRIVGLLAIVFVTIAWSLLSYHPVPFNEL